MTSESCLSGELWQAAMILSMSTLEKPGSCAVIALDAPLLPEEPPEVVEPLPPADVVEPVVSVLELPEEPAVPDEPASALVELDEPPDVPELDAMLEPDAAWKPLT